MKRVLLMLAVLLVAAVSASAMFDVVGEGEEGSWGINLLASTEGHHETSYHVFLWPDAAVNGFSATGTYVSATGWASRLVDSHYFQFWATDASYANVGSIAFRLGGQDSFPVYIQDIECNGDINDPANNITANYYYKISSPSSISLWSPAQDTPFQNVPNLVGATDQSPEASVCALLLAGLAGGLFTRRRH